MFDKKVTKKKDLSKDTRHLSDEERIRADVEMAKKEMAHLKEELENNPEAQELLKAIGSIFGGASTRNSSNTSDDEDDSKYNMMKGNLSDYSGSKKKVTDYSKSADDANLGVMNKLKDMGRMETNTYFDAPDYIPQEYEFDFDPKIISFLFSLDGMGFHRSGNVNVDDEKINPTSVKQWKNDDNPFFIYENTKSFFYRYLDINEEDEKRVYFIKEEVKEDEK